MFLSKSISIVPLFYEETSDFRSCWMLRMHYLCDHKLLNFLFLKITKNVSTCRPRLAISSADEIWLWLHKNGKDWSSPIFSGFRFCDLTENLLRLKIFSSKNFGLGAVSLSRKLARSAPTFDPQVLFC